MIHYTFNTHRSEVKCLFISFDFYLSVWTRMHYVLLKIYLNKLVFLYLGSEVIMERIKLLKIRFNKNVQQYFHSFDKTVQN